MPPIAVNCCSAGFPHHSQRLPRGAESTEIGRRNSWFGIRVLLVRAGKVETYKPSLQRRYLLSQTGTARLLSVRKDAMNVFFIHHKQNKKQHSRENRYLVVSSVGESTMIRH